MSLTRRQFSGHHAASSSSPRALLSSAVNNAFSKDHFVDHKPVHRDPILIALGSNVGNRVEAIEDACKALRNHPGIELLETSFLYESKPMYVSDQGNFLNAVCVIKTDLDPLPLLDQLQAIEQELGRVKTIEKGPRRIDLDIVSYGNLKMQTERLTIPHTLLHEREFVLQPLCDWGMPSEFSLPLPNGEATAQELYYRLNKSQNSMHPVAVLSDTANLILPTSPQRSTQVMAILNTTPDSFSDGGQNPVTDVDALVSLTRSYISAGANIIDIGGQSSRPGAPDISADEEIARVLPAIRAIKLLPEAAKVAISVDTYRASVARAAVEAGADIVNDISAGTLDPRMFETIRDLGCTYIMMHMRGTPATMATKTQYSEGVIQAINKDLSSLVKAALNIGIPRWRIVLDPGIGFAKTIEQNLEILRDLEILRKTPGMKGFPWLVGSSRKGFIGKITKVETARERIWGTAATVTTAIAGGADIVRVHDVEEMAQVVKMSDAIYRRSYRTPTLQGG